MPPSVSDSILRDLGAATLLLGGLNNGQCVMTTLQDANFLGYDCVLLSDCSGATSPACCLDATLYNVKRCFGFVATGAAVVGAIGDAVTLSDCRAEPSGQGVARADGKAVPLRQGDTFLVQPGTVHEVENTGPGRLYCLTLMVPDDDFARLILSGEEVAIDDQDRAVVAGAVPARAAA
jgi:hypothetical protein